MRYIINIRFEPTSSRNSNKMQDQTEDNLNVTDRDVIREVYMYIVNT